MKNDLDQDVNYILQYNLLRFDESRSFNTLHQLNQESLRFCVARRRGYTMLMDLYDMCKTKWYVGIDEVLL
jgi:hypothetical protein